MLVYESIKSDFCNSVLNDTISDEIYNNYLKKIGNISKKEISSWSDSMQYMYKVIQSEEIPNNCGIAIEFCIPSTTKRVDFIISGKGENNDNLIIIIELKRWNEVYKIDGEDAMVSTPLGRGFHKTVHPSYQAWSYHNLIKDYNENVQKDNIGIYPCAFLHNLDKEKNLEIEDPIYSYYIEKAPIYTKGEVLKLRKFISKFIKYGDNRDSLYKIDKGRLKPSKSLQDELVSLLEGNDEFTLIDDQKIVYEEALSMALKSFKDYNKRVLIVEGGPGTGKSILAINLLVKLTKRQMVVHYVSKNSAPRNVYSSKLKGTITKSHIDNLFKSSGVFYNCDKNVFDVLIIDEAHRLNAKSGLFKNLGENQIKEIINASKFSIFFIDENQKIDIFDIGQKSEIQKYASLFNAKVKTLELNSQFRCNGSDGYVAWLDNILGIRETANFDGFEGEYDFRIIDDPNKLRDMILEKNKFNNKSRLLAGYCWNWNKEGKNKSNIHDISIPRYNFSISWNLGNTSTWAIDKKSVNEVGCIHTSQGLDFDYVGVIIGPDLRYESEKIITDFNKRARTDQSLKGIKKLAKNNLLQAKKIADKIIKNTYRTLMTRGQKGCYIYCCDKSLSEYFKKKLSMFGK